uniref:Uncharacterized protein n=1 Tax=viral metagenome TaxID=1070528 RepID=A0A6M3XMX7_9ZZZZ
MEFKELKAVAQELNTRLGIKIKVVAVGAAALQGAIVEAIEQAPSNKLLKKHKDIYQELTGGGLSEGAPQEEKEPVVAPQVIKLEGGIGEPPAGCACPEYGRDYDPSITDCTEDCDWAGRCKAVFVNAVETGQGIKLGENYLESYKTITGNDMPPLTKKQMGAGKASRPPKAKKEKAVKKAAGPKKPGVIATILATLQNKGPITKEGILEVLVKEFPERSPVSMAKTINVQVPGRISKERGVVVEKDDKNRFFIK